MAPEGLDSGPRSTRRGRFVGLAAAVYARTDEIAHKVLHVRSRCRQTG